MAKSTKTKQPKKAKGKVVSIQTDDTDVDKLTELQQASVAEKKDDFETAEDLYKKLMDEKTFNASVYTKLMIIYRKQKRYKEELAIINKGLKHYNEYTKQRSASKIKNASIKKISNSLNKSLGLTDKKGNAVFEPEPIPTWKKRKLNVEKKLKKA